MPECFIKGERCGFLCTGYDGSEHWKKIHAEVESIECETCRDHAVPLMRGVHDLVNVGLGKQAFDKQNFEKFANEVQCAYDTCKKEGRC